MRSEWFSVISSVIKVLQGSLVLLGFSILPHLLEVMHKQRPHKLLNSLHTNLLGPFTLFTSLV